MALIVAMLMELVGHEGEDFAANGRSGWVGYFALLMVFVTS